MRSNLDELAGGETIKAHLIGAGFVLDSTQEGRFDIWLSEHNGSKVRVMIGHGPTYRERTPPGCVWIDVRFESNRGNIVGFCTGSFLIADAITVLDREIREHFSPLFTLLTPLLSGMTPSLLGSACVPASDRGGVSLPFVRGWVGAAQANAAAIADPLQRLAYLEARFAQLKARLEE